MKIKDWNLGVTQTQEFQNWNKKNELALRNIKEPTNPPDWLESQMLSTCYQAIKYDPNKDLREKLRLNDAEGLKEIGGQINAINKLIRFSKTHKFISGSAFLFACARSNYRIPKEEVFSILPKLLEEYKKQLKLNTAYHKTLPKNTIRLNLFGGIAYKGSFKKPEDIKKTSLLFHLVFLFRHYTAGKKDLGRFYQLMPTFGSPCQKAVASIASQVLNMAVTDKSVQQTIRRLQKNKVMIVPWQITA